MIELSIKNLTVSYANAENSRNGSQDPKRVKIFEDFHLNVSEKELVVILGPSGCGKSTLLTAISGLKKPDKGDIWFGDTCFFSDRKKINLPAELRNIGFVFQSYALWPHMTVFQNIAFPLQSRNFSRAEIFEKVPDMLELVHMKGCENRYPDSLSGGEKQRIALARSLVYQPSLLLLDEPLANLDANLKESLVREVKEIQRRLGVMAVYVTHDQNEAFEIADRIVIMNQGRIMQQGSPQEIYKNSHNKFVADFVGKNNILEVQDQAVPEFLKTMKAHKTITIRPEDIVLCPNGPYKGIIKSMQFKGGQIEYTLQIGGVQLMTYTPNDVIYSIGEKVAFNIKRIHSL